VIVKSWISCWALESIGNNKFEKSLDVPVDISRTSVGYREE
jgi:hypothetical protein